VFGTRPYQRGKIRLVPSDALRPEVALNDLTPTERAWAQQPERRWQRAHAIANRHPECDPGDVFHALRCLELSPSERLAAGLQRGRLRRSRSLNRPKDLAVLPALEATLRARAGS